MRLRERERATTVLKAGSRFQPGITQTGVIAYKKEVQISMQNSLVEASQVMLSHTLYDAGVLLRIEKALAQSGNPELRVNSTESMIGDLLGAAGAVEPVAAVKTKYKLVAGSFMTSEKFNFDDYLESKLPRDFGGMERLDMFFPFDPCLLIKSDRMSVVLASYLFHACQVSVSLCGCWHTGKIACKFESPFASILLLQ
ncbi:hypothetical protein L3X38_033980 [Prunus dulcis]|uniref:Uncharacterized protein n=1 Tax=Prunus dulcis TaxID=3755 RepID=A0AAD4YWF0_PRUDU|nr:hypothetical protein L3X38_033980 [Prunus dulcis]